METQGDRIRQERERLGMSRADLAKRIGAPGESYVAALELGQIKKGARLHLVAQELWVELEWLQTGKGPKTRSYAASSPRAHGISEPRAQETTWAAYHRTSAATRAAIDLLLLPARERKSVLEGHELVSHCIEQLELQAQRIVLAMKSA